MMRYFRSDAQTYENARSQLDAAWGFPSDYATTCIAPASTAPRDDLGRIVIAVTDEFCRYDAAATLLSGLLASGEVQEIDAETYFAAKLPAP